MSHVDEGELTAYADGAYPPGDGDAQRIEAHLGVCGNCRARLAQARALSARAAEILAIASPIDVSAPDFADIRSAAATVRRRRNAIPLTWAATVIIALGIGWFGRAAVVSPVRQQQATVGQARTGAASEATEPQSEVVETRPAGTEIAASAPTPGRPPAPQARAGEEAATANALDEVDAESGRRTAGNAPPAAKAQSAEARSSAAMAAAAGSMRTGDEAAAPAAAPAINYMTAAEAERRGIELHVVPELEVLRVASINGEVRVEQKLPDGRVVTISSRSQLETDRSARQDAAQSSAERARREDLRDTAEKTVVLNRGPLQLQISGPLSEDSLRALLAKVR